MAPNKLMGALEKAPDTDPDVDEFRPEVREEDGGDVFPVQSTDSIQNKNDVETESEFSRSCARQLPIDRGWAWAVLGAAIFYLMLIGGIRKNFGIFFVSFQSRFSSSATLTSSLTTTQNIITSVGSLFVMTIGMQFMNIRISIMIGSLLMTTSYLISAFATNITMLYLSVGLMEGLGVSMIHAPVTAAIGEYFDKKRGFANGIAYSGASFGGLIFAPIITSLFKKYGYTGTMMLISGMAFNIMIPGVLMRPMSFYDRKRKHSRPPHNANIHKEDANIIHVANDDIATKDLIPKGMKQNGTSAKPEVGLDTISHVQTKEQNIHLQKVRDEFSPRAFVRADSHDPSQAKVSLSGASSPLLLRHRAWSVGARQRTVSENSKPSSPVSHLIESLSRSKVALYASTDIVYGSVVDIKEISMTEYDANDSESTSESLCSRIKKSVIEAFRVLFDKSLLKNPVFQLYLVMAFMVAPSNVFLCVTIAPHAKDLGFSSNDIGILLSVLSGCGTASRVLTALFSDKKFVKLTTALAGASLFVGIFANCVRFFTTYQTLLLFGAVLGFSCEIYQAIYAVILVEYLTLAKLKSCIGFAMLIHGSSFAIVFQLVGVMRDATGSYFMPYHVLGAMEIIGAFLALSLPIVHRRYNAKKKDVPSV